jgi:hypothetical protein
MPGDFNGIISRKKSNRGLYKGFYPGKVGHWTGKKTSHALSEVIVQVHTPFDNRFIISHTLASNRWRI